MRQHHVCSRTSRRKPSHGHSQLASIFRSHFHSSRPTHHQLWSLPRGVVVASLLGGHSISGCEGTASSALTPAYPRRSSCLLRAPPRSWCDVRLAVSCKLAGNLPEMQGSQGHCLLLLHHVVQNQSRQPVAKLQWDKVITRG